MSSQSTSSRCRKSVQALLLSSILLSSAVACANGEEEPAGLNQAAAPVTQGSNTTPSAAAAVAAGKLTQQEVNPKLRIDKNEFKPLLNIAQDGPIIPGLHELVIPQGLAYSAEQGWLVMSGYRDVGVSVIAIMDAKTGQLLKSFELYDAVGDPYTGHAGGVAITNGYVFVASGSKARYVSIDKMKQTEDGGQLIFDGQFKVNTNASFIAFENGKLWVGEFAHGTSYPTDTSHHMTNRDGDQYRAWIEGFSVNPNTGLPMQLKNSGDKLVPEQLLSIPNRIQGVSFWNGHWVLSDSYGRNSNSTMLFFTDPRGQAPHQKVTISNKEVPLWFLDNAELKLKLDGPPMAEEITVADDSLYINYESASEGIAMTGSYAMDRMHILDMKQVEQMWKNK